VSFCCALRGDDLNFVGILIGDRSLELAAFALHAKQGRKKMEAGSTPQTRADGREGASNFKRN
jgi:hypothetical protein